MSSNYDNFRAWYVHVLEDLYQNRDAGIAVLMISLPLLERYLRRKHNLRPKDKIAAAMGGLRQMFPALRSDDEAGKFWKVYRNGFIHQATMSMHTSSGATLPDGYLTHDIAEAVIVEPDGSFKVHPVRFSKEVIDTISRNFAAFEADPPLLPQEVRLDPVNIPSKYLGRP